MKNPGFFLLIKFVKLVLILFCVMFIIILFKIYTFISIPLNEYTYVYGNKRIVLIETIHLGTYQYYKSIIQDYNRSKNLIIVQGITDYGKILKEERKNKAIVIDHYGMKFSTCHEPSPHALFPKAKIIIGDMDVKELSKLYLAKNKNKQWSNSSFDAYVEKEALIERDNHLKDILLKNLDEDSIVLPWGTSHSKTIKSFIESIGYKLVKVEQRRNNYFIDILKEKIGIFKEEFPLLDKNQENNLKINCRGWFLKPKEGENNGGHLMFNVPFQEKQ